MPSTFYSAYLDGGMLAGPLYPIGFGSRADRVARTRAAAARPIAPLLLERLRAQNHGLPPSPARDANLEALAGTCAAVITGQQLGLFLGPLFTIYKAATAVAVARLLEAESGVRCVPIFWLQTEDHDFVEIAGCNIPRSDGELARVELTAGDELPARASVAHRRLGPDVGAALAALEETLGDLPHAAEVVTLLASHYRPEATWSRAFAGVVAQLFADDGLIVFDPRDEVVARLAAPVIRRSLVEHAAIDAALAARGAELAAAGMTEQVRARGGMPLPFFHLVDKCGPRQRLRCAAAVADNVDNDNDHANERFVIDGSEATVSASELEAILGAEPLRFSTSALLRPLLQDSLLPTAAYVGGPAEVSYFAQLAPLYTLFGLTPPLLAPRARFRLVPPALRKLLDTLSLAPADAEQPRDTLATQLARKSDSERSSERGDAGSSANSNERSDGKSGTGGDALDPPGRGWIAALEQKLDTLAVAAPALDPQLLRAVERTRATVVRALGRLERRYLRVRIARDQTLASRLERLQRWLHPAGEPQERVHSLAHYAARVGPQALVAAILDALDPLRPQPRDIDL